LVIILLADLLLWQRGSVGAQMQQTDDHSDMDMDARGGAAGEPAEVQIPRAMAAGPRQVTDSARIVGADAQGKKVVLREGRNGFTCQPGNPSLGRPAELSAFWSVSGSLPWRGVTPRPEDDRYDSGSAHPLIAEMQVVV
jgi:hypothetical protein